MQTVEPLVNVECVVLMGVIVTQSTSLAHELLTEPKLDANKL